MDIGREGEKNTPACQIPPSCFASALFFVSASSTFCLLLHTLQLYLERHNLAVEGLQFVGLGFLSEAQGGGSFVDEVNGFVREGTVGDVPGEVDTG